jgi:hypothetical protein
MTNPQMTFIETIAWIATRDSKFSDTCRDSTPRRLAISLAMRKSGEMRYRSSNSAEKVLIAKCRSRRIAATGVRGDISGPTAKQSTRISDIEWIDIGAATEDARTGRPMLVSKAGGEYWHEPTFTRADVWRNFQIRGRRTSIFGVGTGPVNREVGGVQYRQHCTESSPSARRSADASVIHFGRASWMNFLTGVPATMTVPDVARQLAENAGIIALKKKDLMDGKHETSLKRRLERTRK